MFTHPLDGFIGTVDAAVIEHVAENSSLHMAEYSVVDAVRWYHGHIVIGVDDIKITVDEETGEVYWDAYPSYIMYGHFQSERLSSTLTAEELDFAALTAA